MDPGPKPEPHDQHELYADGGQQLATRCPSVCLASFFFVSLPLLSGGMGRQRARGTVTAAACARGAKAIVANFAQIKTEFFLPFDFRIMTLPCHFLERKRADLLNVPSWLQKLPGSFMPLPGHFLDLLLADAMRIHYGAQSLRRHTTSTASTAAPVQGLWLVVGT